MGDLSLDNNWGQLGQIKKLRVFINQKNFLIKNKVEITKISINNANFSISQKDLKYFKEYIEKKFSKKKLIINNSNFFILIMKKM